MDDRTKEQCNPEPPKCSGNPGDEPELEDLATTLDPSHIIHLIRQLLPSSFRVPVEEREERASAGVPLESAEDNSKAAAALRQDDDPPSAGGGSGAARAAAGGAAEPEGRAEEPPSIDHSNPGATGNAGQPLEQGQPSLQEEAPDVGADSPAPVQTEAQVFHRGTDKEQAEEAGSLPGGSAVSAPPREEAAAAGPEGGVGQGAPTLSSVVGTGRHSAARLGSDGTGSLDGEEEQTEEAGCTLWDLAASPSHAEFLVENQILDVLHTILGAPTSHRLREIALGVLGNLACHAKTGAAMVAMPGLVPMVVQQLLVDDPPSLTEACRLLSAGLHSDQVASWVGAMESEETLGRIMWMAANTNQPQLLEKSTELLLAMVDGKRETALVLLPALLRLGLPELLTDLLANEMTAITEGTSAHGDVVLDIILQIAEALSLLDDSAEQLAANRKLFSLACHVVRLSDKDEVGPSAITATVLVANLLAEDQGLIREMAHDGLLSGRLVALLPRANDDPGARNALWSILSHICRRLVQPTKGDDFGLAGMAAVLAEGYRTILEDLEEHEQEDEEDDRDRALAGHDVCASTSRGLEAKLITVSKMVVIMDTMVTSRAPMNGRRGQLVATIQAASGQLSQYVVDHQKRLDAVGCAKGAANAAVHNGLAH